ncbi:lysylphosphatidylglycerol synthase transmembrane domain-containing protein [Chiayiivirga flava]|uniref:Uncharacterized protein n=1 Tax=Chiayiivirga flava TaxID=659595 RepID=A0A7W8G3E0_9GAMM|nr:YbhN family protein [Chiayiivirga flava]MBB5209765.1 hypothetical protein [Chiayiivirga flava]
MREAAGPGAARAPTPLKRWTLRGLLIAFYIGVAAMLVSIGRGLDWGEVATALRELPLHSLLLAGACSLACYLLYAGYELLAARHVTPGLPQRSVAAIGFVSYTFNLNLGAILGALGVRLRLYTARGVPSGEGVRIVAFNLLTNWSGYVVTLGLALLLLWSEPPAAWGLGAVPLRLIGGALLLAAAGYLWACARATRRSFTLRGQTIELPSLRHALLQLALSVPVWILGAASLALLLGPRVGFDLVIVTLLASAVAGLVVRIPAGLGVIEGVFLASLGSAVGESRLLAALLAYRCVHYLGPLLLGLVTFLVLELRARGTRRPKVHAAPVNA